MTRPFRRTVAFHVVQGPLAVVVLLLLGATLPAEAQFSDTGTLRVELRSSTGAPVEGAHIEVLGEGLPTSLVLRSGSNGDATGGFLPGGLYSLRVERLGFVPLEAEGVRVVPGRRATVSLVLRPGDPPITDTDRLTLPGGTPPPAPPGWTSAPGRDEPTSTPGFRPGAADAFGALSPWGYPGLPVGSLRVELDDLHQVRALPGGRMSGWEQLLLPPASALARWELDSGLLSHGSAGPGSLLRLTSVRPGSEPRSGIRLTAAQHDRTESEGRPPASMGSGGFEGWVETGLSGDSVRLSAALAMGRSALPSPPGLGDVQGIRSALHTADGALPEAAGTGLVDRSWITGSGSLAWDTGARTTLTTRLHMAHLPEHDTAPPVALAQADAISRSGTDLGTSIHLLTAGESGSAIELRTDIQRSTRRSSPPSEAPAFPATASLASGSLAGIQEGSLGEETRTRVSLTPAGRLVRGSHLVEGALTLALHRHADEVGPEGHLLLADAGALPGSPLGGRSEGGDRSRTTDFSWQEVGLFSRYSVELPGGLTLSLDGRADVANLPSEDLPEAPDGWTARTRMAPGELESSAPRGSGSLGIRWEPELLPGLEIRSRMGVHREGIDPHLVAALLRGGAHPIRTETGEFGAGTSVEAPAVLLAGPIRERPRGRHAEVAASVPLGAAVRLEVGVQQMATRGLSRLRDLNRTPGPGRLDPFGRMIWGELSEEGGLLTTLPGSDRRFPEFARIEVLETDGEVESTSAQASLSLRHGPLLSTLQYRWSRTEDNAPFGPTGRPERRPGASGTLLPDPDEPLGRSDLDLPHLLHWNGSLRLPLPGTPTLGWSHRTHSDRPFTVGVRDVIDPVAWTTGWQRLEPIRIPRDVDLTGLDSTWDSCLSGSGPRERNGCRGDWVHVLDLRLGVDLPGPGGSRLHLSLEGRNLMDRGFTIRDGALFVVEPGAPLRTGADADLALPARLNTDFGRVLADLSPGRSLHIGMEVRRP